MEMYKKQYNPFFLILSGILMGIFFKLIDSVSINYLENTLKFMEIMDIRSFMKDMSIWILFILYISIRSKTSRTASLNVFLFLFLMTTSYYLYTILVYKYNPMLYAMFWYVVTFVSPLFGYILWYAIVPRYTLINLSIIQLAIPVITAIQGFIFLEEEVTVRFVISTCLILGGIYQTIRTNHIHIRK